SAGFNLENGKTNVLLAGSWSDANALHLGDRDFTERYRSAVLAKDPGFYFNEFNPPLGATTNVRSQDGSNLVLKNGTPLNSPITFVPPGYAGTALDGGAALIANAGHYNFALANSAEVGGARLGLTNAPT